MKRFALVLAACSSSPSASTTPSPPVPADASIDAFVVDAAPAVDSELAAAPASVFRFHATGRLETWTLRTVADRGVVQVERMAPDGDGWKPASTSLYLGAATDDGKTLVLALAAGTDKLSLSCTRDKLTVAAATAVRKPGTSKACNWVPAKTASIAVLRCMDPRFDSPMMFAPAPGVEYVFVDADCGGGYRAIAADGALAPVR